VCASGSGEERAGGDESGRKSRGRVKKPEESRARTRVEMGAKRLEREDRSEGG